MYITQKVVLSFRSGTDLLSLLISSSSSCLLGWPLQKKPKAVSCQIRRGWHLARILFTCINWQILDLTHTIISRSSPDTPFHADKCCCLVHAHTAQRLQHAYAAVPASSCSIVHLYLLICICMLLFFWMLLVWAMTAYLCVLITFVKFVITVTFHHHSNVLPWLSLFCSLIASFSRLLY